MPCGTFPQSPRLAPCVRFSPHTAQHLWSFSMDIHEASVPISPAPQCIPRGQLARSLGTFGPIFPKARGLRHQSHPGVPSFPTLGLLCPIQLLWPRAFRWGLAYLLSTALRIHQESPVFIHEGLRRNAGGGVLLNAPSPLWGSPIFLQGRIRLTWSPMTRPSGAVVIGPCFAYQTHFRLDRLTSQARYVRGHFSHRAMHASGDSPWHPLAKHYILEACFFRITPFRSMLLTVQSGLHSLTPRAQSVPAYAQVLRHSSMRFHGAPGLSGNSPDLPQSA